MAAMAVTMVPYLIGYALQGAHPRFGWYSWLGYNFDDACVYLSWIRQAADGHLFQRNLFTTEPQAGHQINLLFLLLGNFARFTHLPLLAVWQLSRVVLGVALLRAVWWLIDMVATDERAKKAAFLLVCFSSGLGWLPGLWSDGSHEAPVDVWQPEAITFLSLYLNPLFIVSLLLMVGVLGWLMVAENTRTYRPALYAGLCGFLLGNIHTYDVITVAAIWGAYLVVRTIARRKLVAGEWLRALVAAGPTAVSTGYVTYLLKTETVFAQRAAVETLSPPFLNYLLGFGLLFPLALTAVVFRWRSKASEQDPDCPRPWLLLPIWAVVNLAVAYLPVAFQRKMVMGEHIPLAILTGCALAYVARNRSQMRWRFKLALATLLLAPTNIRFMMRDVTNTFEDRVQSLQRAFLDRGEVSALAWLGKHAPPGTVIQPLPWIALTPERKPAFLDTTVAVLAPGLTGHPVNAGHWGETPDFPATMGRWIRFQLAATPDEWRRELLRQTGVRYILFTQKRSDSLDMGLDPDLHTIFEGTPPPYLRRILEASGPEADLYEVLPTG